ncbi:DUF1214 domain-containing protein [Porphyrobacter sp. LM 6]|jgi:hypothetical protein|uniref:DUF1214 domain-containing protein n=1 Tax=Porphyrobacter sp. LM 6 TaxID=1896196 RepID=UPI000847443A|nr:DUF1214 domain-containing protein [Porphyrobacter sp. LM 6]AOL93038.1 hypothetical protein BG023_1179 [Porphyrobacter sp. LM 6]
MLRVLGYLAAILAGGIIGTGSALWMAGLLPGANTLAFGDVNVGGWRSDFAIGSEAADPYTRARVARHGLLALARAEAVYLTRNTDEDGRPLTDACTYRLSGGKMPAAWWSVTLYDAASMLPANTDEALSIDASRAGPEAWEAVIAAERPADERLWISSRKAGTFDLTLRLYVPDAALIETPARVLLPPRIERLACDPESA